MSRRGNHEGTVLQRADGRWVAQLRLPDGGRKSWYRRTRAEAQAALFEGRKQLEKGAPILANERQTLTQFLEDWLVRVKAEVRARTAYDYASYTRRYLLPALGRIRVTKLTRQDVERMLADMAAQGLSPRTRQFARAVLRRALQELVGESLAVNAASQATAPRLGEREPHWWGIDEARAFLAVASDHPLGALWTLALTLGLRPGEYLALQWKDVDWERQTVTIRRSLEHVGWALHVVEGTKTRGSRRTLPLPAPAIEALRRHRARQAEERLRAGPAWQDEGWLFTDAAGGHLHDSAVRDAFYRLSEQAGLPRIRLYDLRHSSASLLLALGAPLRVVMEVLRHSSITTTANIYAHVEEGLSRDALDRLGAALSAHG